MKLSKKTAAHSQGLFHSPGHSPGHSQGHGPGHSQGPLSRTEPKTDPLYVIFEQHLFNFQDSDSDRKTFIHNIIMDYLTYLRKLNITVPKSLEQPIIEELYEQINTMLVKKIYGCHSIDNFQKHLPTQEKKKALNRYSKLGAR